MGYGTDGLLREEVKRGKKEAEGKVRLALIPPEALLELGKVYTKGAEKYGDFNWEDGIPVVEALDALERHVLRFRLGQDVGKEGTHEMAHVAFWALALVSQWVRGNEVEDFRRKRDVSREKVAEFLES
jgi:hypothetical protein